MLFLPIFIHSQSFVKENEINFIKNLCNSKKMCTFAAELCVLHFTIKNTLKNNEKYHDKRIQHVS